MALRMTEEEFAAWRKRQKLTRMAEALEKDATPPSIMLEEPEKPKRQKYGNRRVEIDGKKFDSQHEAQVYQDLMLRVKAGELKTVLRQVSFDLPGGIRYVADFLTIGPDNVATIYDAKSEATRQNRVYINKRKQMAACCGVEIVEV